MGEVLNYSRVLEQIPERAPALMIDRMEIADDEQSVRGLKNVSIGEEYFLGHFPGAPIMPGVLQVAAMGQLAGVLLRRNIGSNRPGVPVIMEMSKIKFRKPVAPGDTLFIDVEVTEITENGISVRGKTSVEDQVTCQGNLRLQLMDPAADAHVHKQLVPETPQLQDVDYSSGCDVQKIMSIIPHRYPFLLIDRACMLGTETARAVAYKNITGNEPLFRGLATPCFPGCYQVEAAAQAACAVALSLPANQGKLGYFMSIDKAIFHAPVVPGDRLVIDLTLRERGRFGAVEGNLVVGSKLVAEVALKFALVDRDQEASA